MQIDIGALQSFHDMWAPIMKTLPTVIDAARQVQELERACQMKRNEFDALQDKRAQLEEDCKARLKSHEEQLAAVKAKHESNITSLKEQAVEARAELENAKRNFSDTVSKLEAQAAQANADAEKARQGKDRAVAEVEAEALSRKAVVEAEIAALQARKDSIEESIKALKQQILRG